LEQGFAGFLEKILEAREGFQGSESGSKESGLLVTPRLVGRT
jgi:hypothetical protein